MFLNLQLLVPMPSLNVFYGNPDGNEELNAVRWNVLAWLLSISDAQKNALISCDEDFRAPCATLLVLVQVIIEISLCQIE